jgi:hypothetical protein
VRLDSPWLAALVVAACAAIAAGRLLRGRRPQVLPLADAPALRRAARRTSLVRAGVALAITGALAAAYVYAPRPTGQLDDLVSSEGRTVVVLDMSQSVSDLVYREIARTLEGVVTAAGASGRIGLVLFSDVAQEALPPGSRAIELEPFVKFFRPKAERGLRAKPFFYRAAGPAEAPPTQYPLSPWFGRFSSGTQISTGLAAAREALTRDGGGGRVLLLSDLAEDELDLARLTTELRAYEGDSRLELDVVALPPASKEQKEFFLRATGGEASVVDSLALATGNEGIGEPGRPLARTFVLIVAALAGCLAAFELLARPVSWRPSGTEAGP